MRKTVSILIILFVLVLSACGGPGATPEPADTSGETETSTETNESSDAGDAGDSGDSSAESTGDETTLRVMLVDYVQDETDVWLEEEIAPAFEEAHPGVTVEFIYVNWGTLDETVQGYFAAGEGADIINLGSEYIAQYGDRLAPLNQYLGEDAWPAINQFLPATLDTVTWDGELRGLPWLTAPRAYMCRTDLLAEAGIEESPDTFGEAVTQAEETTVIEEGAVQQAGAVTTGRLDDWQEYINLIWSLGGSIYKDDGSPNFDSPEAERALEFMYERRRAVYPDETVADLPEASGSRLADGTAVCLWANLWGAPPTDDALWENIAFTPGLTDPENFPESEPVVQVFNDWLAVPNYSQNVELAAEFLKFLGSAENLNAYNEDFGSFPPRRDAWTGYVAEDEVMQTLAGLMEEHGKGFADIRETARFREILQREMPAYFTDVQTLEETLENIQSDYTRVLEDAGRIEG